MPPNTNPPFGNTHSPFVQPRLDSPDAEAVALALSEQVFLFQQKIIETIDASPGCKWHLRALEYPVSFGPPGDFETKIDLVLGLRLPGGDPWNLVVECKRANRDFPRWIFFDRKSHLNGTGTETMFCQFADVAATWDQRAELAPPLVARSERINAHPSCPLFNFYVEARQNRLGTVQKSSATDSIEAALRQVSYSVTGLATHLRQMKVKSYRMLPVIVTPAELVSADFDAKDVSLSDGLIDSRHLKLTSHRWLGVNYRIDDSIAHFSGLATTNASGGIDEALRARFVRTVFVVQSNHLLAFLDWAHKWIMES